MRIKFFILFLISHLSMAQERITDLKGGTNIGSYPKNLGEYNNKIYYSAYESDKGYSIWETDLTSHTTVRVIALRELDTHSDNLLNQISENNYASSVTLGENLFVVIENYWKDKFLLNLNFSNYEYELINFNSNFRVGGVFILNNEVYVYDLERNGFLKVSDKSFYSVDKEDENTQIVIHNNTSIVFQNGLSFYSFDGNAIIDLNINSKTQYGVISRSLKENWAFFTENGKLIYFDAKLGLVKDLEILNGVNSLSNAVVGDTLFSLTKDYTASGVYKNGLVLLTCYSKSSGDIISQKEFGLISLERSGSSNGIVIDNKYYFVFKSRTYEISTLYELNLENGATNGFELISTERNFNNGFAFFQHRQKLVFVFNSPTVNEPNIPLISFDLNTAKVETHDIFVNSDLLFEDNNQIIVGGTGLNNTNFEPHSLEIGDKLSSTIIKDINSKGNNFISRLIADSHIVLEKQNLEDGLLEFKIVDENGDLLHDLDFFLDSTLNNDRIYNSHILGKGYSPYLYLSSKHYEILGETEDSKLVLNNEGLLYYYKSNQILLVDTIQFLNRSTPLSKGVILEFQKNGISNLEYFDYASASYSSSFSDLFLKGYYNDFSVDNIGEKVFVKYKTRKDSLVYFLTEPINWQTELVDTKFSNTISLYSFDDRLILLDLGKGDLYGLSHDKITLLKSWGRVLRKSDIRAFVDSGMFYIFIKGSVFFSEMSVFDGELYGEINLKNGGSDIKGFFNNSDRGFYFGTERGVFYYDLVAKSEELILNSAGSTMEKLGEKDSLDFIRVGTFSYTNSEFRYKYIVSNGTKKETKVVATAFADKRLIIDRGLPSIIHLYDENKGRQIFNLEDGEIYPFQNQNDALESVAFYNNSYYYVTIDKQRILKKFDLEKGIIEDIANVLDISQGFYNPISVIGNRIYFSGFSSETGFEPFEYDMSNGELKLIGDLNEGVDGSLSGDFFLFNGSIYFFAWTKESDYQLWRYSVKNITEEEEESVLLSVVEKSFELNISPNPSSNFLNYNLEQGTQKAFYYIYDLTGRLFDGNRITGDRLDISNLKSGNYLLRLQYGDKTYVKRFIKK